MNPSQNPKETKPFTTTHHDLLSQNTKYWLLLIDQFSLLEEYCDNVHQPAWGTIGCFIKV